jgi:demethylmenaquinone methyltransferase/2-methoxy-6-polyprenyl-1,4-benzoquinol methylase
MQKLADAIMLFYDEEEGDRMFTEAGYTEFEHHIQQASPGSPKAITTIATVPNDGPAEADTAADAEGDAVDGPPVDESAA